MKIILISIISIFYQLANSATFTFHACQDNWTEISVVSNDSFEMGYWDSSWDFAFPTDAYSGLSGVVNELGYKDTLSFEFVDPISEVDVWISGPYPDYLNGQMNFDLKLQPEGGVDLIYGGEVWIDFGSDGIGRIELTKPSDFGKWAWDGSINPNYVEPISLLQKNHGKSKKHSTLQQEK